MLKTIFLKASRKLNALARLPNLIELPKRSILMSVFLKLSSTNPPLFGCLIIDPGILSHEIIME